MCDFIFNNAAFNSALMCLRVVGCFVDGGGVMRLCLVCGLCVVDLLDKKFDICDVGVFFCNFSTEN